jgi:hypothetical protein
MKYISKQLYPNRNRYNSLSFEKSWIKTRLKKIKPQKIKVVKKVKAGTKKAEAIEFKKLVWKADIIFAKYIKLRDSINWYVDCITCGKRIKLWNKQLHNCHRIWRGYYSHRRDENNCFWWCSFCNTYDSENHHNKLTLIQWQKYWLDWVEYNLFTKNKKKPSIFELNTIIEHYKEKFYLLEKQKWQTK